MYACLASDTVGFTSLSATLRVTQGSDDDDFRKPSSGKGGKAGDKPGKGPAGKPVKRGGYDDSDDNGSEEEDPRRKPSGGRGGPAGKPGQKPTSGRGGRFDDDSADSDDNGRGD